MKMRRLLSAALSLVMVLTTFTVLTLTVPVTVSAASSETEDAIFIGSVNSKIACAFIPLNISVSDTAWYELECKCLMLKNGNSSYQADKPSIGILGQHDSSNYAVETCPSWTGNYNANNQASLSGGIYKMRFKISSGSCNNSVQKVSGTGNRTVYITVGNAAYRNPTGNTASYTNYQASFIFSDVTVKQCESETGAVIGDNLAPAWNSSAIDFAGTYHFRKDNTTDDDGPVSASANKWHLMAMPDYVKHITVPTDYNTAAAYGTSANFSVQSETAYTREYYTNTGYNGLNFAKLKNSNDNGFEVVSDINKKMIIIDANHEGEADVRDVDGYKPLRNKPANIFIPLSLDQYNINAYGVTTSTSYLVKVSFKAVRLEGEGYPVLGRITAHSGNYSQALGKMAKNINLSAYYGAGSHETYTGCDYTYNESTGEFVGWMRMKGGDSDYRCIYGTSEILTIGNCEHVWAEGTFDTTEFNTSFAISDIKVDLYSCTNPSGSTYTPGSLLYEDIAPSLYADNIDDTTNWAYHCESGKNYSNYQYDVARAKSYVWQADGNTGMVHAEDLTACIANRHELVYNAATENSLECWGCSTCRKVFADPYGKRQISGSSATFTEKMIYIEAANNKSTAFIPVNLNGFDGGTKQWYKFTCKVRCIGDGTPVVSTLYNKYTGNQCETTQPGSNDGDMAVIESSYDPDTGILTGYIKAWIPTYNRAARYPFIRYNPVSGANVAIIVGNGRYIGNGFTDQASDTSFAIAAPTLHKIDWYGAESTLSSAKEAAVLGDNLIAPISDKTVDFGTSWSQTWTASNNPLAAPMGYWYRLAQDNNNVTVLDIPAGYFESDDVDGDPKMLRLSGAGSTTNQQALNLETHLEASKTYQFDLDYRVFGGAEAYINIQTAAEGGSYSSSLVTYNSTASNVDGAHRSVRFTMPADARSTNNFKTYIGQKYPLKNTGVVYFANASLREVTGESLGDNLFLNGDFHKGLPGNVSSGSAATVFYGWGQNDVLNYPSVTLMPIPYGFFSGTAVSGDNTIALKTTGGNYVELQFKVELKPDTYYRLQFDYRNIGNLPRLDYQATGAVTITKISDNSAGKYRMTYQIYSDSSNAATTTAGGSPNTRLRLKFGASSSEKALYINNVQLFELTGEGGNPVGANIMGNLNPILDESYYSSISETGDTADVTLTQDASTNVRRNLASGWFGANYDSTSITEQLVRVPSNFFNYLSYSQRIELLRKTLLGIEQSDGINPHYNPNNDEVWGDVCDLVHAKRAAIDSESTTEKQLIINNNPLSNYMIFNDSGSSSAVSAVDSVLEDYLETDVDLSTTSSMPANGKAIHITADNSVSPDKCRVAVSGNTLEISAYRAEFIPRAIEGFASLLSGNTTSLSSGYSREFSVATEAYSSGSDKRIIGGSTMDSIGYNVGDTATVRLAAVSLSHAKILTGVSYFKIHMYNETTGATSDTYVTPTNGVYEFNITSGSKAGFVFWYAIACDSGKNSISAFYEVDSVSGTIYHFAGSVGFGVDSLSVSTAKPSDFNTYWQGVASGIGSTSGATLTSSSADSGYSAYLVKIPCGTDINGNQGYATGYLTYPSGASSSNKIKLKVKFQSYGVSVPDKLYEANTAVFNVCAHSMDLTSSSSKSAYESYKDQYGFNYTASTVEGTYFYQMIRRDLTAAKFMVDYFGSGGNNYWNGTDFEAAGNSMGGFQSTAVAALLKYATANGEGISHLNIKIPYMCDLNGENNGRMPRYWGTRYTNSLKYFDTAYFGSMVTCKTTIYAGLGDSICPASGTYSLYKAIAATDKMITYQQGATHSSEGTGAKFSRATGAQALALAA